MSSDFEKRKAERKPTNINAFYDLNGIQGSCEISDISSTGLKMRVKGLLYEGDHINIKIDNQIYKSIVANTNGNIVGVRFEKLSDTQLNYIMKLQGF